MILAAVLSALLMKRRNMSVDLIYLLFIVCIPTAIVGARLFSCLTDPKHRYRRAFSISATAGSPLRAACWAGFSQGFVVLPHQKGELSARGGLRGHQHPHRAGAGQMGEFFQQGSVRRRGQRSVHAVVSLCRTRQSRPLYLRHRFLLRSRFHLALRLFLL